MRTVRLQRRLIVLILLSVLLLTLQAVYNINLTDDTIDFKPIPELSFAKVSLDMAEAYLSGTDLWPVYQGYNDRFATPEDSPLDPHLRDRISMAELIMNPPSVRVKGIQEANDWKFQRIIHQTWKDNNIPAKTAPWVSKWLEMNPGWTHMFWTDKTQREFIAWHYPQLLKVYDSWTVPVQRADMFRYIALYAFGGIYADLDVEVLRPLDEIRDWGSCILSREPDPQVFIMYPPLACWANNDTFTCNAFLACRRHHPFLHYLIGRVVQNSPYVRGTPCPLDRTILCTGPWLVSFSYTYYLRSIGQNFLTEHPEWNVLCPDYRLFLPTYDPSRQWLLIFRCKVLSVFGTPRQRAICGKERSVNFANVPESFSYTNHNWLSSYHHELGETVDVTTVSTVLSWSLDRSEKDYLSCNSAGCL